jgi:hypothetical protein
MKKLIGLSFLSLLSSSAFAFSNENCGYWEYVDVEVCDTRTVYVDVPKTKCNFVLRQGAPFAQQFFTTYDSGHVSCPAEFSHPFGLYDLSGQEHYETQKATTEQFNCRTVQRRVWIGNSGGPQCNIER